MANQNNGQRQSASARALLFARSKALIERGVTIDLQKPIDYIREKSFDLNTEIIEDASFVFSPSSMAEFRLYNAEPRPSINLIAQSETFTDGIWGKAQGTVVTGFTAPNSANTATKFVESSGVTNVIHWLTQQISNTGIGEIYNLSCYLKAAERTMVRVVAIGSISVYFDLTGGTIALGGGSSVFNTMITNEGDGWYRCSFAFAATSIFTSVYLEPALTAGNPSYSGDGVSGFYCWGMQMTKGLSATTYVKTLDNNFDFVVARNAITATAIQKDNSIKDMCYNLATNSEFIATGNTFWNYVNGVISTNDVILAPDNAQRADKYAPTIAGSRLAYNSTVRAFPVNTIISVSVYAKAGEASVFSLGGVFGNEYTTFDVSAGTITFNAANVISSKIEADKNGWYRCSVIYRFTNAIGNFFLYSGISSVIAPVYNGVNGMYFWGYQVVHGDTYFPYLKTGNRFNFPTIDYTLGADLPALLIEPQRQNLLTFSEDFSQSAYPKNGILTGVTTTNGFAPNNLNSTNLWTENTANTIHGTERNVTTTANQPYTVSLFLSASTRRYMQICLANAGNSSSTIIFDTETGTITDTRTIGVYTFLDSVVTPYANGFYRVSLTASNTVSNHIVALYMSSVATFSAGTLHSAGNVLQYVGDGVSGMRLWGLQFEQGNTATSYIPTAGASLTRNSLALVTGSAIAPHIGQPTGTMFLDFFLNGRGVSNGITGLMMLTSTNSSSDQTNSINFRFNQGERLAATIFSSGTTVYDVGASGVFPITNKARHKVILTYSPTLIQFYLDGVLLNSTSGSFNIPTVLQYLHLGNYFGGISNISVFNSFLFQRQLSGAECIALTTL